jgi:exopolysaccharide biosynthesis polyprenyl glycosylphosphotransferase
VIRKRFGKTGVVLAAPTSAALPAAPALGTPAPGGAVPRFGGAAVIRTRLQQRRPIAVRRHASRMIWRLGVTILGDTLAVRGTWYVLALAAEQVPALRATLTLVGSAAQLTVAMLVALLVTGNYGRRLSGPSAVPLIRASALATAISAWQSVLARGFPELVTPLAFAVAVATALLWVGRRLTDAFSARLWPGARAVLVGRVAKDGERRTDVEALFGRHYRFVGHVAPDGEWRDGARGPLEELGEIIDRDAIETIVVAGELSDHHFAEVLDVSLTAGCELLYPARAVKFAGVRPRLVWRANEPFLELGAPVLKAQELLAKRIVDMIGATIGLMVLWPALLAIAVAVRLDSPGTALFSQHRVGLGGRRFRMLKFRTMRVGADAERISLFHLNDTCDIRLFKIRDDPRVTRLGRWLRRWSLDELPQLWNVLRGDMSLVGPRPFFEADLEAYEGHHFRRFSAKPGITGLWQVSGRSDVVNFEEVIRLDREYIETWSLWLDLRILAKTFPAVFRRTGAY